MQRTNIRDVHFCNVTLDQTINIVVSFLRGDKNHTVVTPNSEIVQMCIEDDGLRRIINAADLVIPDGIGVIYAARILKRPLSQKVAGIDLAMGLLPKLHKGGYRLFLLGGQPGVAEAAKGKIEKSYPGTVCGVHDGYFTNNTLVIDEINKSGADLVFVCLGAPKQEMWMAEHKDRLSVKAMIGLGGTLDVFAGRAKRAPDIFIKLGLEWFYRLLKEPRRIGRMMRLPRFLLGTIGYSFTRAHRKER